MMCQIFECESSDPAERWCLETFCMFPVKKLPQRQELVLRFVQNKVLKSGDCWDGPLVVKQQCGHSMV